MSPAKASKGVVILVEDEDMQRNLYASIIEGDGYTVIQAEDGEKGWALIQEHTPDLVLLDMVLPKMTGDLVLEHIRKNPDTRDIPVLVFSISGRKEDIQKGLELGANDYAVKGTHSPKEILNKMHALLSASKSAGTTSYHLLLKEGQADAAALQHDIGLTKSFVCPHCKEQLSVELLPDPTRKDGHWFATHIVCQKCERGF